VAVTRPGICLRDGDTVTGPTPVARSAAISGKPSSNKAPRGLGQVRCPSGSQPFRGEYEYVLYEALDGGARGNGRRSRPCPPSL